MASEHPTLLWWLEINLFKNKIQAPTEGYQVQSLKLCWFSPFRVYLQWEQHMWTIYCGPTLWSFKLILKGLISKSIRLWRPLCHHRIFQVWWSGWYFGVFLWVYAHILFRHKRIERPLRPHICWLWGFSCSRVFWFGWRSLKELKQRQQPFHPHWLK